MSRRAEPLEEEEAPPRPQVMTFVEISYRTGLTVNEVVLHYLSAMRKLRQIANTQRLDGYLKVDRVSEVPGLSALLEVRR